MVARTKLYDCTSVQSCTIRNLNDDSTVFVVNIVHRNPDGTP